MYTDETSQPAAPRFRAYVHLGRGSNVPEHSERYRRGTTNDLTPYGFHLAREAGVHITFSNDHAETPLATRRNSFVGRRLRFDFFHAWANRNAVAECDVVWSMTESETFAVAALMLLRIVPRRPIIGNAVWLFNRWTGYPAINRWIFQAVSRSIAVLTVHSERCLPLAREVLPDVRCELTYFGINPDAYPTRAPSIGSGDRPIRVLAAGNDATRDWQTCLAALGNDARFTVCAWTPALTQHEIAPCGNVSLPKPATHAQVLALFHDCDVVVIPMFENIFSGITVALEAVFLGRPVVCSETGGVPTYFAPDEVTYVPPGDPDELRKAVLRAFDPETLTKAEAAQATFNRRRYITQTMIDRYIDLSIQYL